MPAPIYSLGQMTPRGPIEGVLDLGESVENRYVVGGVEYSEGEIELVEFNQDAGAAEDGSEHLEAAEVGGDHPGAESGLVAFPVGSLELLQSADSESAASVGGDADRGADAE